MRLPRIAGEPAGTASSLPGGADVERLLSTLRTLQTRQTADGLEARVSVRLRAQSLLDTAAAERRMAWSRVWRPVWLRFWAPAALAASLICVFTGGFIVARQTPGAIEVSRQARAMLPALPPAASHSGVLALPPSSSLATASARRKPVTPVPAGRQRGRGYPGAPARSPAR